MNGFSPVRIVLLGSAMLMRVSAQLKLRSTAVDLLYTTTTWRVQIRRAGKARSACPRPVGRALSLCPPCALLSQRDRPIRRRILGRHRAGVEQKWLRGEPDTRGLRDREAFMKRKTAVFVFALGIEVAMLAGSAHAQNSAASAALDASLRGAVERRDVPGVIALITDRERVLYQGAFGVADV